MIYLSTAFIALAAIFAPAAASPVELTTEVSCHSNALAKHGSGLHAHCEALRMQNNAESNDLRIILTADNADVSVTELTEVCSCLASDLAPAAPAEAAAEFIPVGFEAEAVQYRETLAWVVAERTISAPPLNECTNFQDWANFFSITNISGPTPGTYLRVYPDKDCVGGSAKFIQFGSVGNYYVWDFRPKSWKTVMVFDD